jgi:hypothetical protein
VPEDEKERLSRKLEELLQGLRVIMPGVQVLFAFLLTVPFTGAFRQVSDVQRDVYFAAFLCAAVASVLLIAPSAYHRARWHYTDREALADKQRMLETANRQALAGTGFLALAMTGTVFLVTDVLFGGPLAAGISAALAGTFVWFWYGLPLTRRLGGDSADG